MNSDISEIYCVFEGQCPAHPTLEVKVINVCGTLSFIKNNLELALSATELVHIWAHQIDTIDGEIEFACTDGCRYTISHNDYGDWNF